MSAPDLAREFIELELALLDDPAVPSRSAMDDEKLEELAARLRSIGLQQPIVAVRVGDRFRVIAGHRRRLAAIRAGLERVPSIVYAADSPMLLTVQAHENARREELNPADEGIWFAELLETVCAGDIEKLAGMVGEKVHYCDGRLSLVRGDAEVFAALRRNGIKLGVAHELNKVSDPIYRKYFLTCAEMQGATVSTVARWIQDWRQSQVTPADSSTAAEAPAPGIGTAPGDPFTCIVCGKSNNVHLIRQINVHQHCKMAILDPLLGKTDGEATP